ncbi:MAG: hypothetical protein ABJP34_02925 [Erythrobacter sp.]
MLTGAELFRLERRNLRYKVHEAAKTRILQTNGDFIVSDLQKLRRGNAKLTVAKCASGLQAALDRTLTIEIEVFYWDRCAGRKGED